METEFVSIGFCCSTAEILRAIGLLKNGYPFDWLFSSLKMVKHCLETRFKYYLDKQYYQNDDAMRHTYYQDMIKTEQVYRHHELEYINPPVFRHHNLINQSVYESFVRRYERFLELYDNKIENKKMALVYCITKYTEDENYDLTDIIDLSKYIKQTSPKTEIIILKLMYNQNKTHNELYLKDDNLYVYNVFYNSHMMLYDNTIALNTIKDCLKNH